MWNCGDEVCNCTRPRVSIFEEREHGYTETVLWEGDFHSDAISADYAEQCRSLVAKAREHAVENLAEIEKEFGCFFLPNYVPSGSTAFTTPPHA